MNSRILQSVLLVLLLLFVSQSLAASAAPISTSPSVQVREALPGQLRDSNTSRPTVIFVQGFKTTAVFFGSDPGNRCSPEAVPLTNDVKSDFGEVPSWLAKDGLQDLRIAYLTSNHDETPSLEVNALCLQRQIQGVLRDSPKAEIVIIGHSMGGLVIRAYVDSPLYKADTATYGKDFIRAIFTIGTPHQGIPIAPYLKARFNCQDPSSPQQALCEFSDAQRMEQFNQRHNHSGSPIPLYAIGGTRHNTPFGLLFSLYLGTVAGDNDGAVPTSSAITIAGKHQSIIVDESHLRVVGIPSYFEPASNMPHSQSYIYCLRPVLVDNNPDGCTLPPDYAGSNPIFRYIFLVIFTLLGALGWYFIFRLNRRVPLQGIRRAAIVALGLGFLVSLYLIADWATLFLGLWTGFAIGFTATAGALLFARRNQLQSSAQRVPDTQP